MIIGYVKNGFVKMSFETFKKIKLIHVEIETRTFISIFLGSAKIWAFEWGMDIYQNITKHGFPLAVTIASLMKGLYTKCEIHHKENEMFDKMSQWDLVRCCSLKFHGRHMQNVEAYTREVSCFR